MTQSNEERKIEYIVMSLMKGIGPVTQNALRTACGGIGKCFSLREEEMLAFDLSMKCGRNKIRSFLAQRNDRELWERAEDIMKSCKNAAIDVITPADMRYPDRFIHVYDAPEVIYTRGSLKINDFRCSIGVVGARRCSAQGKEAAIAISEKAVSLGAAVISGMAKGIDSYAHTAALKSGGYTIAVLGNGADICYPGEHFRLYEKIVEENCIVSEYPPGTIPRPYMFPQRNRLIAALSDRLYVIDAGRNSGTGSTVTNAEKYGREVIKICGDGWPLGCIDPVL